MIPVKNEDEIEKIKKSAHLLSRAFRSVESVLEAFVTTRYLDEVAEETIRSGGGIPAFKGYMGFPGSICASIDSTVVHGIPGSRRLQNGEIIAIDIGVLFQGYYSDAAKTYAIGDVSKEKKVLMEVTRTALHRGIKKAREGNHLSDISHAVQTHVESNSFSVIREFVGHGIGQALHEEPQIPNFGNPHCGPKLKAGMVLAIEPMVSMGNCAVVFDEDGWTVKTMDGSPSAHFEHTVLITSGKPDILTIEIEDRS
ncbi:MAG TPA: type I methionyl aminopeptidase [bacterium]|nr:type I methionyl aminopeptidase [bacterium]